MWIVNFEGIVVDWDIAQRRVALGERATLTGAGNRMGRYQYDDPWIQKMAHGTRRNSHSNPSKGALNPSLDEHRATGCDQYIRNRMTVSPSLLTV